MTPSSMMGFVVVEKDNLPPLLSSPLPALVPDLGEKGRGCSPETFVSWWYLLTWLIMEPSGTDGGSEVLPWDDKEFTPK